MSYEPTTGVTSNSPEGPGTPWLVKFPAQNETAETCAVKALYANLSSACGMTVPATRYFDLGSGLAALAAFGIERFDREAGMRVPTNTAAGALNADFRIPSAMDYTTLLRHSPAA